MMSSKGVQSFVDPVTQSKMPRLEGTIGSVAPAELSKPGNLPKYPHNQALQYSGAYFTYDLRGQDGSDLPPPWSPTKNALLNGRNLVIHPSSAEGSLRNHIVYKPENMAFSAEASPSSAAMKLTEKQGFTYYHRSPGMGTPKAPGIATPVEVRNNTVGGMSISPPSENSVCLAIPKPVYGHSPCCSELGCTVGHRYSMDRGTQKMHPNVYDHDEWMYSPHYSHRSLMQGKVPQAFMKQRAMQLEHTAERLPLKDMMVEEYHGLSPNRAGRLPAFIEPNYSGYSCTPARSLLVPSTEQCQRLQIPSKCYHGLYPSHPPTYEHMTSAHHGIPSQVYHDRAPMSKYGQLTQRPIFYYPQANVELESGATYKDVDHREDAVPTVHKHTPPAPPGHYLVSPPLFSDVPIHSPVAAPSHQFLRSFDHPPYPLYRMHLNAVQISSPTERSCAPPHSLHPDRPLDYSQHRPEVMSPRQPRAHSDTPGASPVSPTDYVSHNHTTAAKCTVTAPYLGITSSPGLTSKECSALLPNVDVTDSKGIKRCKSDRTLNAESPSSKHKEDSRDAEVEIETFKKRPKREMDHERAYSYQSSPSPPLPVINSVFSLAPYKAYLEAAGMFPPLGRPEQPFEYCVVKSEPQLCEQSPKPDRDKPVVFPIEKRHVVLSDTHKEKPAVEILEPREVKIEKFEPEDTETALESHESNLKEVKLEDSIETSVKEEVADTGLSDNGLMLVVKICEPDELGSKPLTLAKDISSLECKADPQTAHVMVGSLTLNSIYQHYEQTAIPCPKTATLPQPPEGKIYLQKIPPQCLKLSTYKINLPDVLRVPPPHPPPPTPPPPRTTEVPQQPVEAEAKLSDVVLRPARQHFMELHQSLCMLISSCVSRSPKQELRAWLSRLELPEPPSPSTKALKVSCLLGTKAREVWLSGEGTSTALRKILQRLSEYESLHHCPFPHVMRTGAVFIPMLVVKEILFPQVQGPYVDQVLQEHKVQLRPTTLSEERHLTELQRRPFSSKHRRLMSLKHLPDIYADVLNLFYHTCVCKHLGVAMDESVRRGQVESSEEADSSKIGPCSQTPTTPTPSQDLPKRCLKDLKERLHFKKHKRKDRKKGRTKRRFLGKSTLSQGEEVGYTEHSGNWSIVNNFNQEDWDGCPVGSSEDGGSDHTEVEKDLSVTTQQQEEPENSWVCPLTSDELSSSPSDIETERASTLSYESWSSGVANQDSPKSHSGMILKLRRVLFSKGRNGRETQYQAVSDPELHSQPLLSEAKNGERREARDRGFFRGMSPKVPQRRQRVGGFSHTMRTISSSSQRLCLRRSLMKIKYCPYLSACHSAEHRRRWVLRSAVQRARRAMKIYYPDLVGKRICHLYEENDKTEVWYRGVVVRIHEPHPNPLKTVFEVKYDSEPEWQYYLELLIDYKKGWLKVED